MKKKCNFREKKNSQVRKERENLHEKGNSDKGGVKINDALKVRLVNLNHNFECDWLINCPMTNFPIKSCPITT